MSFIQRIIEALDAKLWKFIRIIHSANHDLPYHDYVYLINTTGDTLNGVYKVGANNVDKHGDQSKFFVSKRANIWTDNDATTVQFNDSRNVAIALPPTLVDPTASFWLYKKDFYTNIAVVYYSLPNNSSLWMYFEGVLPEEARDAE